MTPETSQSASRTIAADFAVVGAGFAGLSTAYHLARTAGSKKVILLEREGAERLLKQGDMFVVRRPYSPNPLRVQGATIAINELALLLNYWKIQKESGDR